MGGTLASWLLGFFREWTVVNTPAVNVPKNLQVWCQRKISRCAWKKMKWADCSTSTISVQSAHPEANAIGPNR